MKKFIETSKYKELCNYGPKVCNIVGHGLGLAVHDHPAIPGELLKKGMVITVEPGLYMENFGGVRIEDDVLIKDDGNEILSNLSKEYLEI